MTIENIVGILQDAIDKNEITRAAYEFDGNEDDWGRRDSADAENDAYYDGFNYAIVLIKKGIADESLSSDQLLVELEYSQ